MVHPDGIKFAFIVKIYITCYFLKQKKNKNRCLYTNLTDLFFTHFSSIIVPIEIINLAGNLYSTLDSLVSCFLRFEPDEKYNNYYFTILGFVYDDKEGVNFGNWFSTKITGR